ncbi:MAG: GNAT family N-acetyltransferase [Candidatus Latescibacteria bacterium]|nr:GNAT family N-acetyltransferase [Candidatus Latescibacterota bacterium]
MLNIRPFNPGEETAPLAELDTRFTTERIYRVRRCGLSFVLEEEPIDPPYRKHYPLAGLEAELATMDQILVAELGRKVVGFTALKFEAWNRQVVVHHLYVAPPHRGCGAGRRLLDEALEFARMAGARGLWLETQNTNYPAIRFYLRTGFRLCGLDDSLYDPAGQGQGEVGLFFARDL